MITKAEFDQMFHSMGMEGDYEKFSVYCGMLQDWNQRMNLTAITDDRGIAVKHFADSVLPLSMAERPRVPGSSTWAPGRGSRRCP